MDLITLENEDGIFETFDWPFCEVEGCKNRQYLKYGSKFCYPHTFRMLTQEGIEKIARSTELHEEFLKEKK
jgi:hypothetical protein